MTFVSTDSRMIQRGVIALMMIIGLTAWSFADVSMPVYPTGKGERCVEPTDVMRRDHFEYLMHHRQVSVHLGVRSKRHSLVGCVDCHASRADDGAFLPVNASGQFCQSCHAYTAVKIDCFGCHAAVPAVVVKQ